MCTSWVVASKSRSGTEKAGRSKRGGLFSWGQKIGSAGAPDLRKTAAFFGVNFGRVDLHQGCAIMQMTKWYQDEIQGHGWEGYRVRPRVSPCPAGLTSGSLRRRFPACSRVSWGAGVFSFCSIPRLFAGRDARLARRLAIACLFPRLDQGGHDATPYTGADLGAAVGHWQWPLRKIAVAGRVQHGAGININ